MVMVFSLKSRTAPISCKVCLPMIRLYRGLEAPASYSTMFEGLFRPFFFEFSHLLGLLNDFPGLAFCELLNVSPKPFNIATTAVTLPVFEVSIAISLALDTSIANLVANLRRLSARLHLLLDPLS